MVTAAYPTPGRPHSGTFIKSQIDSLAGVGVESTVVHLQGRTAWKYVKGAWQVFRLINSRHFDLVHAHYGYCGIVARAQWRAPVVVSFCGDDLLGAPDEWGHRRLRNRLEVLSNLVLAQLVDGIIVKSQDMRKVLRPAPRVPTAVISNGVDLELFHPIPRADARQRLALDPDTRYALFPADPSNRQKGFRVAQSAIECLRAHGVPVELIAAFGRPQRELVDLYNAADVVVLPSLSEGSPNVVKEAMACGVPVVVADVGDVRELVGSTPGCAVVERAGDAFAGAIGAALDLAQRRTAGRNAVEHLSLETVAERVRDFYTEVLSHRRQNWHLRTARRGT